MNKKTTTTKWDLEDRLIEFAVRIIDTAEALPKTVASKNLSGQIVQSATSLAGKTPEEESAIHLAGKNRTRSYENKQSRKPASVDSFIYIC